MYEAIHATNIKMQTCQVRPCLGCSHAESEKMPALSTTTGKEVKTKEEKYICFRAWVAKNRERFNALHRKWSLKNKTKIRARQRAWVAKNRQKVNLQKRTWALKHRASRNKSCKAWKLQNKNKVKEYSRRQAARDTETISDGYICRHLFKLNRSIIPPALIAAKRAQLQLNRFVKEQTK